MYSAHADRLRPARSGIWSIAPWALLSEFRFGLTPLLEQQHANQTCHRGFLPEDAHEMRRTLDLQAHLGTGFPIELLKVTIEPQDTYVFDFRHQFWRFQGIIIRERIVP